MVPGKLTKRYTRALFELADEDKALDRTARDLHQFAQAIEGSEELREVLRNPSVSASAKREVLDAVLKRLLVGRLTHNFIMVLLEKRRVLLVASVAEEFQRLLDGRSGRIRAEVTSATPLGATDLARIRDSLQGALGAKEVTVDAKVDPALIGGIITRIGNIVLDGSVRNRIESMRDHLLAR